MKVKVLDFSNPKNVEKAINDFRSLLVHPGYQLMKLIVEENINFLRKELEEGTGDNETKEMIDRIRDKIRIHNEVINTPSDMIKKLTPEEHKFKDDDDCYEK